MTKPKWQPESWANHQEFIRRAQSRGALNSDTEVINFLCLALCGEAGELANLVKKIWRGDTVPIEHLRHELADVRIYLEHLSQHLGFELDAACEEKVQIVAHRLREAA